MNAWQGSVLIVGAGGQLARVLHETAPPGVICQRRRRSELDVTDSEALMRTLEETEPDMVINGAAYNLVDRAEGEGMEEALRVNALGVRRLADACRTAGVPLVHFSTDLVFDGLQGVPYTETDLPRPLNVYGVSKLAGEYLALAADPRNLVIRVCRLFGPAPAGRIAQKPVGNFPLLMLHLAQRQDTVRVVDDQIGSPSYLPDVAQGVWELVRQGRGGLFHLSNAGAVSFAEFAREVFRRSGIVCRVEAVSSADYGAAARRPLYSVLDNNLVQAAGIAPLRPWQDALTEFLVDLQTAVV